MSVLAPQQAFLGMFSFVMPAVLLSGFPSPVENMPQWLQYLDWLNPLRHFIVIVKGVLLKGLWPKREIEGIGRPWVQKLSRQRACLNVTSAEDSPCSQAALAGRHATLRRDS